MADILDRFKLKHLVITLIFLSLVLAGIKIRIKNVEVMGTDAYTDDEAIELVFSDYWDSNTFVCLVNNLLDRKKDLPFIADYSIVLTGPVSCDLIIYEKSAVGCIDYMGSFMYFDRDGIIIESSPVRLEGVPVIEGVDFGHIVLGEALPVENDSVFADVMTVTGGLSGYDIDCEEIYYSETMEITVTIEGGDIRVEFGTNEDISSKMSILNDMLPELKDAGLKGVLDLTNYSESSSEDTVSFRMDTGD